MIHHVWPMLAIVVAAAMVSRPATAQDFVYHAPGKLQPSSKPGADLGEGDPSNRKIYSPDMGLPIVLGADEGFFLNSQVYRPGGMHGVGPGGQCAQVNYSMPWSDNFCETRGRRTFLCPNDSGHQGVDIRPTQCKDKAVTAVAVEDGTIMGKSTFTSSVTLKGASSGSTYIYLHLDPPSISVDVNQKVKAGDPLGKISNFMNGSRQTTIHLHFEIRQTVDHDGRAILTHVPPYTSLVHAYRQKLGLPTLNNNGELVVDETREKQ